MKITFFHQQQCIQQQILILILCSIISKTYCLLDKSISGSNSETKRLANIADNYHIVKSFSGNSNNNNTKAFQMLSLHQLNKNLKDLSKAPTAEESTDVLDKNVLPEKVTYTVNIENKDLPLHISSEDILSQSDTDDFAKDNLKLQNSQKQNFGTIHKRSNRLNSLGYKRKWTSFNSWGKRGDGNKWPNKVGINTWEKRNSNEIPNNEIDINHETPGLLKEYNVLEGHNHIINPQEVKRWAKSMQVWGKRNDDDEVSQMGNLLKDKKWGKAGFNTWGKRSNDDAFIKRWGKSALNAWGKRTSSSNELNEKLLDKDALNEWDKDQNVGVKKWTKSEFNTWGKRSDVDDKDSDDKRWTKSGFNAWGKRSDDKDINSKKWSKNGFNAWGKRSNEDGNNFKNLLADIELMNSWDKHSDNYDKRWAKSGFNAWGKRSDWDDEENIDKRWSKSGFNAWGKRNDDNVDELEKRWTKSGFNAWGKRADNGNEKRWENNALSAWGKRLDISQDMKDTEKRWAKSGFNSWGKRNNDIEQKDRLNALTSDLLQENMDKRWGKSQFNTWGKRSLGDELSNMRHNTLENNDGVRNYNNGVDKRKWGSGMNAWGKRSDVNISPLATDISPEHVIRDIHRRRRKRDTEKIFNAEVHSDNDPLQTEHKISKRRWSTPMHVWGKRTNFPFFGGPKRGWKANEMKVWGKRSWDGNKGNRFGTTLLDNEQLWHRHLLE